MITRRGWLRSTVAGTGALVFSGTLPGLRAAVQNTPPVRRSLGEMDLDDPTLETLREFVKMMKDPAHNGQPLSWISFADVHGTRHDGFNLCPHGNWYFLPWHRGYLRMYEIAARAVTGNEEFALPYWDWTEDRQIPRSFSDKLFNGKPNPLFVPNRNMGPNDSLPDHTVGKEHIMDEIYEETSFEAFASSRPRGQNSLSSMWIRRLGISGPLESTPHNTIHDIVGGPFMGGSASAQDPIFLMHHCNIDRIWSVWNSLGRRNTSDPRWLGMQFANNFIAPDGKKYTDIVRKLQEVVPLGYTYGHQKGRKLPDDRGRELYLSTLFGTPEVLEEHGFARFRAEASETADPQHPLTVPISPDVASLKHAVRVSSNKGMTSPGLRTPQVYAIIRELNPTRPTETQLRLFVNCDYLSQDTPTSDPHYVTAIGFFGVGAHGGHKPSLMANLTPALKRLARVNRLDTDQVAVQLLPTQQHGNKANKAGSIGAAEVELVII